MVLGAALDAQGRPGPMLIRRAETACRLFHQGRAPLILATGGAPGPRGPVTATRTGAQAAAASEAEAMAAILRAGGVPEAAILLEPHARNTWENARFSIPLLRAAGASRAILVTDRLHMPRALMHFRLAGMATEPAPCRAPAGRRGAVYAARELGALAAQTPRTLFQRLRDGRL